MSTARERLAKALAEGIGVGCEQCVPTAVCPTHGAAAVLRLVESDELLQQALVTYALNARINAVDVDLGEDSPTARVALLEARTKDVLLHTGSRVSLADLRRVQSAFRVLYADQALLSNAASALVLHVYDPVTHPLTDAVIVPLTNATLVETGVVPWPVREVVRAMTLPNGDGFITRDPVTGLAAEAA